MTRAKLFTFLCLLLISYNFYSQEVDTQDTLVYLSDIKFNSEYESRVFNEYLKEKNQSLLFDLFLSIDSEIDTDIVLKYKERYTRELNLLSSYTSKNSNDKKNIKFIYKNVHSAFFTKYEMENKFSDIFKNGFYNCVSGSALYGLFLSDLSIPFQIKLRPNHVFLLSYPETSQILIETTNPAMGYIDFDKNFKTNYVNYLKNTKQISKDEFNLKSIDDLFKEYYFKEEIITLENLVGIQYYNDGLYKVEDKKIEEAIYQFQKADLFYSSPEIKLMLMSSLAEVISKCEYDKLEQIKYFTLLTRFKGNELKQEDFLAEFGRITNYNLINDIGRADFYDEAFNYIIENVSDSSLIQDISFYYSYERSRNLMNFGKYDQAFPFMEEAYKLNPDNSNVQVMFIMLIGLAVRDISDNYKILETINNYNEKYPQLIENDNFRSYLMLAYLNVAFDNIIKNKVNESLEYISKFEDVYVENSKGVIDNNAISRVYSHLSSYYFRKGNYRKAKTILEDGLKYVPGNYELNKKLMLINSVN